MPNRILREGILTSERIAKLSWPAEVFYRRLMSVVDDFGRYHAHPMMLRAACYPLQLDKVREADVIRWLAECEKADLLVLYDGPRGRFAELLDFRQQVRAKDSKFPPPPSGASRMLSRCVADAQQVQANAHLDVDVSVDVDGAAPKSRKRPKIPIPEGFGLSERVIDWAKSHGFSRLQEHLDHFRLQAAAQGYLYADWDAALMKAIRSDWAKVNGKGIGKFAGAI